MNQFYALLRNGQLRYVDLATSIIDSTKEIFIKAANDLMNDTTEAFEFNGRYVIRENENEISFIKLELPTVFNSIPNNQAGITTLDIEKDVIKSIFWYEEGVFIFQLFSSGNLLQSKYVIRYLQESHNFNKMTEKAFIINNKVQAIYKDNCLYFKSFPSASQIFDLGDYMVSATDSEVLDFGNKNSIDIDVPWLMSNANVKTRRLIKMVAEAGTLDTYMIMKENKRKELAQSVNVDIVIKDNKLVIPRSVSKLNKVLEFLNEDVYKGLITSTIYTTNSKRKG